MNGQPGQQFLVPGYTCITCRRPDEPDATVARVPADPANDGPCETLRHTGYLEPMASATVIVHRDPCQPRRRLPQPCLIHHVLNPSRAPCPTRAVPFPGDGVARVDGRAVRTLPLGGRVPLPSAGRDDAFITYWAAHAIARFGEIVNYDGDRVEQSSSLLHTVILAILHAVTGVNLPTLGVTVSAGAAPSPSG